jgi:hypothetical protein
MLNIFDSGLEEDAAIRFDLFDIDQGDRTESDLTFNSAKISANIDSGCVNRLILFLRKMTSVKNTVSALDITALSPEETPTPSDIR